MKLHNKNITKSKFKFTGNRSFKSTLPDPIKEIVKTWCNLNGIFIDEDHKYITIVQKTKLKEKIIKLYLNYHHSKISGKKYIIASNNRKQKHINISKMIAIEIEIQKFINKNNNLKILNSNLLSYEE